MRRAIQISKPCQRAHQRGYDQVNSVCLNKDCQIRLICGNCTREGYHNDHQADFLHFDHLEIRLEKDIADYRNAGILALIDLKKKQFKETKVDVLKTLDLLEDDFMQVIERATEADQLIRDSIQMVQTNDFLLFKERQAQGLVDLRSNKIIERLKRLVAAPIISELQSFNQILMSKLQSAKINGFLKKNFQEAIQIETFQMNRLNYHSEMAKERKLILEERVSEMNEANTFYLGGYQSNLKHGRGILVKVDSQEIFEGLWENNSLRWGLKVGRLNEQINFIYVGSFENDKREGKGIIKWSNGDSFEGDWTNDKKEGKGIFKNSEGEIEEGLYKDDLSVGEHKVYKPTSQQPFKIKIYGENGQVQEIQMLEQN